LLTEERAVAGWYEKAVAAAQGVASPKAIANWVIGEVFRLMGERNQEIGALKITPAGLAELAGLVERGAVNISTARDVVFGAMAETGESPAAIVAEKGLGQISDRGALEVLVAQVLRDNPGPVNEYLNGKETLLRWFIGQVMRASRGKANPALVQQVLLEQFAQME
jgi:aspartyl-tRNA(Asn)/glutamyl-tRNA(Gln) amidotransferase subunit B